MNLTAFSHMLLRRGWIIVLLGALGAAAGLAIAVTQTPVYEAVTRVAVRPKRSADLGQTQAIKNILRSYMSDIPTLDMAQAVSERLAGDARCAGYDLDPGRLLGTLRVSTDENVFDIQVKARSPDTTEAVCVSEKWAEAFVDRREKANLQLDPLDRIITEQRDDTRWDRIRPRRRLLVLAAGVAGVVLGGLLLLLLEYFESAVVRNGGEAEAVAGASVLGSVPPSAADRRASSAVRAGLRDMVGTTGRLLRLAWPLFFLTALGAASAFALSSVRPPIYRARTKIAVEPARGSDWGQTQAIREIMRGFSEDIKTRRMAAEVSARGELDLPPDALLEKLNVASDEGVYEIHVDIRDPDEEIAKEISRAWAQVFVEDRARANLELDQRDRILTRLRDQTKSELWAPKRVPNTLAGAVLGALVGAAAAFLLHLARAGVVLSPADADRAAGVPLLGVIPSAEGRRASGGAIP